MKDFYNNNKMNPMGNHNIKEKNQIPLNEPRIHKVTMGEEEGDGLEDIGMMPQKSINCCLLTFIGLVSISIVIYFIL